MSNAVVPVLGNDPDPAVWGEILGGGSSPGAAGGFLDRILKAGTDPGFVSTIANLILGRGSPNVVQTGGGAVGPVGGNVTQAGAGSMLLKELLGGAAGALAIEGGMSLFGGGGGGERLPSRIVKQTGTDKWGNPIYKEYVSRGRPILYSGDLAAAKRVMRAASKARRARPRSRTASRSNVICGHCATVPCACK